MPHTGTHAMDGTMRYAMLTTEYTELYYVDQSSPTAERALNGNSKVHPRHHGLASDSDVSVCPRYGPDPRGKTSATGTSEHCSRVRSYARNNRFPCNFTVLAARH
jgi:hypothetical protein